MKKRLLLYVFLVAISFCVQAQEKWDLGNFVKTKENPIVKADPTLTFFCPVKKEIVKWQKADVLNPAAIVKDGKVYLLAQVKCYDENKKVDTPVIRHLIGDSSFYKYNVYNNEIIIGNKPLYLIIFSYSGFTKPAEIFAKSNSVVALNGHELIDIICNFEASSDFKSVTYLLDVNKRLNK